MKRATARKKERCTTSSSSSFLSSTGDGENIRPFFFLPCVRRASSSAASSVFLRVPARTFKKSLTHPSSHSYFFRLLLLLHSAHTTHIYSFSVCISHTFYFQGATFFSWKREKNKHPETISARFFPLLLKHFLLWPDYREIHPSSEQPAASASSFSQQLRELSDDYNPFCVRQIGHLWMRYKARPFSKLSNQPGLNLAIQIWAQ